MTVLTYKNDWESDIYYADGTRINDIKSVEYDGKVISVQSRRVQVPYYDMGKQQIATSMHFFVRCRVLGVEMEIDLNKIVPHTTINVVEWT